MFTGIITECGRIRSFEKNGEGFRMVIEAGPILEDIRKGDSIAVNGCCLTAVTFDQQTVTFDLLAESVRLTTFQFAQPGDPVNLEPALPANGRLGGHFVTGHVDALGKVLRSEFRGADKLIRIAPPTECLQYLVPKGSIAVNGVSLTVADLKEDCFDIWLIPHTLKITNLDSLVTGSQVQLETDILAKYVLRGREFTGQ